MANSLIITGFVDRAKRRALNNKCILSIYFHKPSKAEFEASLRWLKKNEFQFLSTTDIEKIIKKDIPFPKGGVLITVDDGWQSNEDNVVEIAQQYRVPVTIFVSTAPVEEGAYWWSYLPKAKQNGLKYSSKKILKTLPNEKRLLQVDAIKKEVIIEREAMTVDQVKKASQAKYVTIGSHTHTHPILTKCSEKQVYDEMIISRKKLETWIGKEVPYFAYTNGDYGKREVEILKTLNYRLAFSTYPGYLTPAMLKEKYALPRFLFLEGVSFAENICRMVGIWQPLMQKIKNSIYFWKFKSKKGRNTSSTISSPFSSN